MFIAFIDMFNDHLICFFHKLHTYPLMPGKLPHYQVAAPVSMAR
ncbi:hypothetical protein FLA_2018 [Filimonas lacunae]|nr:hypothetical protein FLA_2018 [Filimonas lacunae]